MRTRVQNLIAGFIRYLVHLYRVVCHDYHCNMLDILPVFESIIPTYNPKSGLRFLQIQVKF